MRPRAAVALLMTVSAVAGLPSGRHRAAATSRPRPRQDAEVRVVLFSYDSLVAESRGARFLSELGRAAFQE